MRNYSQKKWVKWLEVWVRIAYLRGGWLTLRQCYSTWERENQHTAQMWVLVSEPRNWRKINYRGSESISHGFSITLRMAPTKQLQLWNMLRRGLRKQEPVRGIHFNGLPSARVENFQWWHLIASGLCCGGPLHWARERKREGDKKRLETCHRGNAKTVQLYRKLAHFPSRPPSPPSYLTLWLFNFQRPAGAKRLAQRGV